MMVPNLTAFVVNIPSLHYIRHMCNLRSGPTLAFVIHFLLRAPAKIGPYTSSLTFVLNAARFWPQR